MKQAFADTLYWIAIIYPDDQWHSAANEARERLGAVHLVTTDEVLTELLAAIAKGGTAYRQRAARFVRSILESEDVTVMAQSRETFLAGLELYERRADKGYSLTDCVSMNTMRQANITDALTNDRHFTQEGFTALISR